MRGSSVRLVLQLPLGLLLGACGFSAHARGGDAGGGSSDGASMLDASVLADAPPGQACFGSLAYTRVCYSTPNVPTGMQHYQVTDTIDTGMAATCTGNVHALQQLPGNPCIIAYDTITFTGGGNLTITGTRPVIFLATGASGISMASNSVIDASSRNGNTGAGAIASCTGTKDANGQSGGFGGSFTSSGGAGGLGVGDHNSDLGGAATMLGAPVALHGGCPGGVGGNNTITTVAMGGGAVALVAATLSIDGLVAAAGDGGAAPPVNNAGGNGGGAGGMIVLDSPSITGSGELDAKGGGGGEGRGGNPPTSGTAGYYPVNRLEESLGGSTATSTGGDGGHGGPRVVNVVQTVNTGEDGFAGTSGAGGGGGGGAAGVVIATSALPGLLTSNPAPQ
ncbi:MAG TPA: hypothetical protein VLT45_09100 [Kofleriaceae bacterium]|nr:hypothetical protein [Kofleriaceae bacterium]